VKKLILRGGVFVAFCLDGDVYLRGEEGEAPKRYIRRTLKEMGIAKRGGREHRIRVCKPGEGAYQNTKECGSGELRKVCVECP